MASTLSECHTAEKDQFHTTGFLQGRNLPKRAVIFTSWVQFVPSNSLIPDQVLISWRTFCELLLAQNSKNAAHFTLSGMTGTTKIVLTSWRVLEPLWPIKVDYSFVSLDPRRCTSHWVTFGRWVHHPVCISCARKWSHMSSSSWTPITQLWGWSPSPVCNGYQYNDTHER